MRVSAFFPPNPTRTQLAAGHLSEAAQRLGVRRSDVLARAAKRSRDAELLVVGWLMVLEEAIAGGAITVGALREVEAEMVEFLEHGIFQGLPVENRNPHYLAELPAEVLAEAVPVVSPIGEVAP